MNIGIYAYGVRNKETLHSQSSLQLIYFSSVMIFIISSNNVQIFDHFAHLPILPMSSRTSSNFSMTSSNSSSFLSVLWDCSETWFKCSVATLSISLSIFFFSEFFCRDKFSIFSSHFFLWSLFLVILQSEYWSSFPSNLWFKILSTKHVTGNVFSHWIFACLTGKIFCRLCFHWWFTSWIASQKLVM